MTIAHAKLHPDKGILMGVTVEPSGTPTDVGMIVAVKELLLRRSLSAYPRAARGRAP